MPANYINAIPRPQNAFQNIMAARQYADQRSGRTQDMEMKQEDRATARRTQNLQMATVPYEFLKLKSSHISQIAKNIAYLPTEQRIEKYAHMVNTVAPMPITQDPQMGPLGVADSSQFIPVDDFAKMSDADQMKYLKVVSMTAGELAQLKVDDAKSLNEEKQIKLKAKLEIEKLGIGHKNRLEEIRTGGEEARKTAAVRNKFGTAPTDEMVETLSKQVIDGRLDPQMISKRGGLQQAVFNRVEQLAPGFNLVGANANARYATNPSNLQSRGLAQGVEPLYEQLEAAGQKLDNSNLQAVNKVGNWLKEKTGDPDIVAFNNLRDDVVAETERVLLGTGVLSDSKYQRALHNLNSAQSWPQMKSAIQQLRNVVSARLEALDLRPFPNVNPAAPQERMPGSAGGGNPFDSGRTTPAPPQAVEHLKRNPQLRDAFLQKYGYLPEGF